MSDEAAISPLDDQTVPYLYSYILWVGRKNADTNIFAFNGYKKLRETVEENAPDINLLRIILYDEQRNE